MCLKNCEYCVELGEYCVELFDSTLELQDSRAVAGQTLMEEVNKSRPLICNQLREKHY